ncbi:MAG: hypothetical protein CR972_04155 [Candidatus Moraniibacteriota bacterium]|nr:MAG: hypothetical protein CR972_04155 [Candidatus Moranbacteria bacterium]
MVEEKKKDVSEKKKEKIKDSEKKEGKKCFDGSCASGGKNIFVWIIIGLIVIGLIMVVVGKNKEKNARTGEPVPVSDNVAEEVKNTVNEWLALNVPADVSISAGKVMEEKGFYSVEIVVEGQSEEVPPLYITKDMMYIIPQVIEVNPSEETKEGMATEGMPATEAHTKLSKPEVEVFVMSHCPYGTQIEKGMIPVFEALGNKIDGKFKFVDYAMHGVKEVTEQLRQYCIQEKEPQKFLTYLTCFLEDGDATRCNTVANINQAILNQCVAVTDEAYKVTELLEDKSAWVSGQFPQFNIYKEENEKYGVQGSPTLVINGEKIQSGRDSASLLAAVCSGFEEQPEECQAELSSTGPAAGFGGGTTSEANTDAGCGA